MIDSVSDVLVQHLRLLRVELADDARFFGSRLAIIAGLAPLVLVGYGFLCAAIAVALQRVMPFEAALALVGAVNVLGGGGGIAYIAQGLKDRQPLTQSLVELEKSTELLPGRREGAP
ncbi:MAG: phage holin family protein [Archangium sp.]|nr:phage holin family protein [Archangium sp.]